MEYVGYFAAMMTTAAFMPQALMTIRTRDTSSLSLTTYILIVLGTFAWLAYGLAIGSTPIIIANIVTSVPVVTILMMKLRDVMRA